VVSILGGRSADISLCDLSVYESRLGVQRLLLGCRGNVLFRSEGWIGFLEVFINRTSLVVRRAISITKDIPDTLERSLRGH
jgi:hypothetical protein